MRTMQIYVVDESYKKLNFPEKVNEMCKNLRIEIDEIDMLNFNNIALNSKKDFPFDGMESKEVWEMIMSSGLKLKTYQKLELAEESFFNRMNVLMGKLFQFASVAYGARLKYVRKNTKRSTNASRSSRPRGNECSKSF